MHVKVSRTRTEPLLQNRDPLLESSRGRAAPPRVDHGHGPSDGVDDRDGNTVRDGNGQEEPAGPRHMSVGIGYDVHAVGTLAMETDDTPMDLASKSRMVHIDGGQQRSPTFPSAAADPVTREGEVEGAFLRTSTRDTLHEPGKTRCPFWMPSKRYGPGIEFDAFADEADRIGKGWAGRWKGGRAHEKVAPPAGCRVPGHTRRTM